VTSRAVRLEGNLQFFIFLAVDLISCVYCLKGEGEGIKAALFLSQHNGSGSKWCGAVKVI
jgi:hypothetical protein